MQKFDEIDQGIGTWIPFSLEKGNLHGFQRIPDSVLAVSVPERRHSEQL